MERTKHDVICELWTAATGEKPNSESPNWKPFYNAVEDVLREVRARQSADTLYAMTKFQPIPVASMQPEFASGFTVCKEGMTEIGKAIRDQIRDGRRNWFGGY